MTDKICDTCKIPKPGICFEHRDARRGTRLNTCQTCLREARRPALKRRAARLAEAFRANPSFPRPRPKRDYALVAEALTNGWNHRYR